MLRKSNKHLSYYASPDDASPRERAVARFACRLALFSLGHQRVIRGLHEELLKAAGRLLFWSGPLLSRLTRRWGKGREGRSAAWREADTKSGVSLRDRVIGEDDEGNAATAAALIDPAQWESLDSWFARLFQGPAALWQRLLHDTLEWIDSAKQADAGALAANIRILSESLQLSDAERAIVELVALVRESEALRGVLRYSKAPTVQAAAEALAPLFGIKTAQMLQALQPSGTLAQLGLVGGTDATRDLEDLCMQATNMRLYNVLLQPHAHAHAFLGSFLKPAPPARIVRESVQHMSAFFDLATQLLGSGLARRETGIHVLLHGAPGSGKTEFARLLAGEMKLYLYEIGGEDESGSSANCQERLSALVLAALALKGRGDALLLFDEAEDVFPGVPRHWLFASEKIEPRYAKAWMNRLLETLPVPVIWISNCIDTMDGAYLRRFTLHVRFPELPRPVKHQLAEKYLGETLVGEQVKQEIARLPALTPGQLQTAARVLKLCDPRDTAQAEQMVRLQLRAHREAVGLDYLRGSADAAIRYHPGYVHLREPMTVPRLLAGLRSYPRAALCFYGLPGTGKTQLAHHLADELGRELVCKSASDLLSMWVGRTEKLIAELFAEAEDRKDEVVILLDEADTFLRDRALAYASWELSHTNEFLTRMERFPGVFICTTNLVDTLDAAILRRFQFRIEFLAMRSEQSIEAFRTVFGREPTTQERDQLRQLSGLVPADFANVARQRRFFGDAAGVSSMAMLRDEVQARRGGPAERPMGFVAN